MGANLPQFRRLHRLVIVITRRDRAISLHVNRGRWSPDQVGEAAMTGKWMAAKHQVAWSRAYEAMPLVGFRGTP
jgi:hypothetical protein